MRNKTQVTVKQLDRFLHLCWVKYVKAKVEPGASSFVESCWQS